MLPEELSPQTHKLCDVINEEPDLPCALICASFLDECLASLLRKALVQSRTAEKMLDVRGGILGEFSARSGMAYSLGLITKGMYQNLMIIAEIRNLFAHSHLMMTFGDPLVSERCCGLQYLRVGSSIDLATGKELPASPWPGEGDSRSRFTLIVILMANRLLLTALETNSLERRTVGWE
jgi:hypothetical protein